MSNEQTKILKEILDEVKIINAYLLNLRIEKAGQQTDITQSPQTPRKETEKTPKIDAKTKKEMKITWTTLLKKPNIAIMPYAFYAVFWFVGGLMEKIHKHIPRIALNCQNDLHCFPASSFSLKENNQECTWE